MENEKEGIPIAKEPDPDSRQMQLETALKTIGDFRFNRITSMPEILFKKDRKKWIRLDDYTLNSIVRRLKKQGFKSATRSGISELLESDFALKINPIARYFETLNYMGDDPIIELASTVKLAPLPHLQNDLFCKYLKKWMVGAVANVYVLDKCANHLCLILAGPQGTYKSTWIRNLCPPELRAYYIEGSLDPDNKDSLLATSTNFIFNLDDYFAGISARKINEFKGLLTKSTVKVRRAYARYPEEVPKICSFIASSNEAHFLYDTTGNRRFLPFQINSIDIDRTNQVSIDQAWAQAYDLFQNGFVYWLTKTDQQELAQYSEQFEVQSTESELIIKYLRPPQVNETPEAWLTNADILEYLQKKVSLRLSTRKLGQALVQLGFPKIQRQVNFQRSRVYPVIFTQEAGLDIEQIHS